MSASVSSEPTHWGLWLHAVRPLPELADLAASAEELGAAAILVADEGTDRDIHVTLAALAQRTRSALLFAAVTNPLSRHPITTAAAFASLAELAPGRIVAGFGAGGGRVSGPMGLTPTRPFSALEQAVEVVGALLDGKTVDHDGEFVVRQTALSWSRGAVPLAMAGRGPKVTQLAAERADWVLLAGKAVEAVESLVEWLRARGLVARGRPPAIAWNPVAAWTEPMVADARAHLAYMVVDLPPADRRALGVDDGLAGNLRQIVNTNGPEAAARLVPQGIVERYAVVGDRPSVVARLTDLTARIRPELLVFDAGDYSVEFLEQCVRIATDAGVEGGPLPRRRPTRS
jgi:5,10-methylenetetrahydromethanopterin reductase